MSVKIYIPRDSGALSLGAEKVARAIGKEVASRRLDAEIDDAVMLVEAQRRRFACRSARNERVTPLFHLPIDERPVSGLIDRSVAKKGHQGRNRAGKHRFAPSRESPRQALSKTRYGERHGQFTAQ